MRTKAFMMMAAVCFTLTAAAKDIKTVVFKTQPEMHCANCENKIKTNIRFEKGVKDIVTDLNAKTVTVKYDADKTTVDNLVKGFAKIDYKATVCTDATSSCCGKANGKVKECCKKAGDKVNKCCQKAEAKTGECCKKAEGKAKECCKKAEKKVSDCCKKAKADNKK